MHACETGSQIQRRRTLRARAIIKISSSICCVVIRCKARSDVHPLQPQAGLRIYSILRPSTSHFIILQSYLYTIVLRVSLTNLCCTASSCRKRSGSDPRRMALSLIRKVEKSLSIFSPGEAAFRRLPLTTCLKVLLHALFSCACGIIQTHASTGCPPAPAIV